MSSPVFATTVTVESREAGRGVEVVAQAADEAGAADPAGEGRDVHGRAVCQSRSAARRGRPNTPGAADNSRRNNTKRLDAEGMTRV